MTHGGNGSDGADCCPPGTIIIDVGRGVVIIIEVESGTVEIISGRDQ